MSTQLTDFGHSTVSSVRPRSQTPKWLREPLLHFVILGGVLFAADHFIVSRSDDPHVIVIDAAGRCAGAARFSRSARGHEPNADELYALRKRVARQRSAVPRRTRAAARQGRRRDSRAGHLQAAERHRRQHQAAALRRRHAARVVREEPREVRRAGALRLPGGDPGRRQVRAGGACVRELAERGRAGRRQSRPARVHEAAAREPRAELRRGVCHGARCHAGGRMARCDDEERLARHASGIDRASRSRRTSKRWAASSCTTGPMRRCPSSAAPP